MTRARVLILGSLIVLLGVATLTVAQQGSPMLSRERWEMAVVTVNRQWNTKHLTDAPGKGDIQFMLRGYANKRFVYRAKEDNADFAGFLTKQVPELAQFRNAHSPLAGVDKKDLDDIDRVGPAVQLLGAVGYELVQIDTTSETLTFWLRRRLN